MLNEIALIGYSGHAYVVQEALQAMGVQVVGYVDLQPQEKNPFELKYLGSEAQQGFSFNPDWGYALGLGSNVLRQNCYSAVKLASCMCLTIVSPGASVSPSCEIGEGSFVARGVQVNALASIGVGAILNTGSSVDHECVIDDFVHVAPGAVLAGNVTVGKRTFIGANATVKQGVKIGDDVVIGAGSVVLKDVASSSLVYGNPAKIQDNVE
jgi:sugar O-acyltransferase (sialic acid O-acetyltransferase NeuD family)